jgi:hypothetical protein
MSARLQALLKGKGPRWRYARIWMHALLAAFGATAVIWGASAALAVPAAEIFAENSSHELVQSVVLAVATLAAVVAVARSAGLRRYAALVTGLISFIGFLRETPTCRGDVEIFCAAPQIRSSLIAVGAAVLIVATLAYARRGQAGILQAIHPRFSWPLALAAGLVGASQIGEILHLVALEETLELYSYFVLMLGAVFLALMPTRAAVAIQKNGGCSRLASLTMISAAAFSSRTARRTRAPPCTQQKPRRN